MRLATRLGMITAILLLCFSAMAQDTPRISIQLQSYMADALSDEALADFEAEHGVEVVIVEEAMYGMSGDPETQFEELMEFATQADVFYMDSYRLTPELVRAGFLLNLEPLIQLDYEMADDIYPGLLESFRWDGGLWAIPITWQPITISYNAAAFDEQGLNYPNAAWTLDDFNHAASLLAKYDENGNIIMPGLLPSNNDVLLRALYGKSYYTLDGDQIVPDFVTPELVALLEQWNAISEEDYMNFPSGGLSMSDDNPPPLSMSEMFGFENNDLAPLPGGYVGVYPNLLAISSGTAYPEIAYALVEFMTRHTEFTEYIYGVPARQSVLQTQMQENTEYFDSMLSPKMRDLLETVEILPWRETLFGSYFSYGGTGDSVDIESQLNQTQDQVQETLETAATYQGTQLAVVPPPLPPELAPGEIALKFGMMSYFNPMMIQEQMEELADEFAANHPTVGYVDLDLNASGNTLTMAEEYDCFIISSDFGMSVSMLADSLVSLDPLMASDPNFDPNNMVPGVLDSVQSMGQTWALPLNNSL